MIKIISKSSILKINAEQIRSVCIGSSPANEVLIRMSYRNVYFYNFKELTDAEDFLDAIVYNDFIDVIIVLEEFENSKVPGIDTPMTLYSIKSIKEEPSKYNNYRQYHQVFTIS